ncbi:hypothetical protein N7524_011011 [Penicillium chrysogenum]|nr:hypothetical protein N7524_011011 [Penicillium chrysogenum]
MPTMIDVSDGDTEPLSILEFWATFDDGGSHVPQSNPKSALTNSNCDLTPYKSKYSQSPIFGGSLELEFPHAYLEEERSEATNPPKIEDTVTGKQRPTRYLVVEATSYGLFKVMNCHLSRLAIRRVKGLVNVEGDMEERTILGIGDQSAW